MHRHIKIFVKSYFKREEELQTSQEKEKKKLQVHCFLFLLFVINSLYKVISPERISLIVINNYPTILLSMQYYAETYTTDFVNILCTVN